MSTPTLSNKLALAVFDTLATTRFTPICFTRSEHRRFFSSLLVTLTATSQAPISSSLSNSKSVPLPCITKELFNSSAKNSQRSSLRSIILTLSFNASRFFASFKPTLPPPIITTFFTNSFSWKNLPARISRE